MINKEFFEALSELQASKNMSEEEVLSTIENTVAVSLRNENGSQNLPEVKIELNKERFSLKFYVIKHVVEEVTIPERELTLEEAKALKSTAKLGDTIKTEIIPKEFNRVAIKSGKDTFNQKIKDHEKSVIENEFKEKEGEIISGIVRRIDKEMVYIETSNHKVEAVLPKIEQIPGEKYQEGQRIKILVKRLKINKKSIQFIVSRTTPNFVRKLFELEVPEIASGIVTVKGIVRQVGYRTKIAVYSEDPNIDPVGSCVGPKGVRVNAIVSELNGEKIDIIPWCPDPLEYIARALAPAKALSVIQLEQENSAQVIVANDKLSLAIGKNGLNAKLAVMLTGWKIDVKPQEVGENESEDNTEEFSSDVSISDSVNIDFNEEI